MAWSTIRKATDNDTRAVREAAERFCQRHGIDCEGMGPEAAIDCTLEPGECASYDAQDLAKRLRPLWRRILQRITGSPDGIAYGYVGRHVD